MIKYYETENCYYKVNFSNRKYDVIYKPTMNLHTDERLPYGCNIDYFMTNNYKEITEEQYNYMLEI